MENGSIGKAFELAFSAHRGQIDKLGEPYITHLVRVASALKDPREQIVALLHDVIEDCGIKREDIAKEFGPDIANAVDAISKRDGEGYEDYLRRVTQNPIALRVKRADLADNSAAGRVAQLPMDVRERLQAKYAIAAAALNAKGAI